ncbi:MAG: urea amidolyase [Verrucomicrobia bacterium]|nr:MAG: urea amidolyase [Verrucomicrobiota bacterium]
MKIDITRAGFLTSVQDLGRLGFRQFGVSVGGALDSHALRVANLLVGNDESAAGLEITLGGLRLRFVDDRIVAWCGGGFDVRLGSTSVAAGHAALVRSGQELMFNQPKVGCRCWLGISGEIDVPIVLGSRSTDLRTNFGGFDGRALRDGDEIALGRNSKHAQSLVDLLREQRISPWSPPHDWSSPAQREPILRVMRGSDWNRFNDVTIQRFTNEVFIVSPDSDRMGVRLEGIELKRNHDIDLISEAVVPGTIQVPPGGKPIVLLGDCQTIGGYPKIAHVISVDLPIAAQLRVGDRVRFHEVSLTEAHQLLAERERDLAEFRVGIKLHVR